MGVWTKEIMVICIWPFDLTLLFHTSTGQASAQIRCPCVYIYIYIYIYTHTHTHTHTDTQFMKAAMLLVSIKVTLLVRRVCKLYVAVCTKVRSFFGISQMDRSLCACEPQDVCSGKSSPVTGLDRPRGLQEVKVPRFRDNGTGWWSVVSLTHRPPLPPGNIPGTHFC